MTPSGKSAKAAEFIYLKNCFIYFWGRNVVGQTVPSLNCRAVSKSNKTILGTGTCSYVISPFGEVWREILQRSDVSSLLVNATPSYIGRRGEEPRRY